MCLCSVAAKAERNLMSISNLGVCFGPCLLRPAEETVAAILNIKFCNIVVEIMIENYEKIFQTEADPQNVSSDQDHRYYPVQQNHRPVSFLKSFLKGTKSPKVEPSQLYLCLVG